MIESCTNDSYSLFLFSDCSTWLCVASIAFFLITPWFEQLKQIRRETIIIEFFIANIRNIKWAFKLRTTFGGMCSWRRVAVAWVFAIVLDVEIFQVHEIIKKCKNHDTKWERPGVQPGPAGWFCAGGFSRQAELINHQLVFGVLVELSARKDQPKAIAYTDLLATEFYWYSPNRG